MKNASLSLHLLVHVSFALIMPKTDLKSIKLSRPLWSYFFSIIPSVIFILGSIPVVLLFILLQWYVEFFSFSIMWNYVMLPIIVYLGAVFLFLSEIYITGGILYLFRIVYEPGIHEYSFRNKNTIKWTLICVLYTPVRKLLDIFPMGRIKISYLRLLGMKIGKNSLIGGVIKDPCLTEFGDNVTMGEYAIIYCHIHNMQYETITMKRIRVGNNCIIGAGAIIMPGAVIEDDVIVAAGALVIQDQVLTKGKTYGGVPAKEIVKRTPE